MTSGAAAEYQETVDRALWVTELEATCKILLLACRAARGTPEREGLFSLGVGSYTQELDQSDSPGAAALRARAGKIHRQIDAAMAGVD